MLPAPPHCLPLLLSTLMLMLCAVKLRAGVENMVSSSGGAVVTGIPWLPVTSESRSTAVVVQAPYNGIPEADGLFIYHHLTGTAERLLTEGDALTSLNGQVGSLLGLPTDSVYGSFGILPQLNALGLGCICAEITGTPLGLSANEALLRFGGPEGVAVLMAESQSLGTTGRFVEAFRHRPYMNDETGITWVISTRSTLLQSPPPGFPNTNDNPDHALMAWLPEIQTQPIIVAQSGEMHAPTTGGSAELGILFQPRINNQNHILVASGARAPGELNWYEADHLHLWTWEDGFQTIASINQNIPGGSNRKITAISSSRLGPDGEVFFLVEWSQPGTGGGPSSDGEALLKWQDGVLTSLLAEGDPVPGLDPSIVVHSWAKLTEVTASGEIAMVLRCGLAGSQYPFDAIFKYGALGIHEVPLPMAGIPDVVTLESIGSIGMNDLGLITFEGRVRVSNGSRNAVFLTNGQTMVEISRGASLHDTVGFPEIAPVTSEGQVAFVNLGQTSTAGLFTPDLALKPFGNFWDDRSSFTLNIPPSAVHRVTLQGDPLMPTTYFGGPSADTTVRRLNIGGAGESVVFIDSGGSITALEGIHVESNGTLSGGWALHGTLNCTGTLSPGPAGMSVNGYANLASAGVSFTPGGPIIVTGSVVLPATVRVESPTPEAGDYPLITASGTLSSSTRLSSAPAGKIYQLTQPQPNQLHLQVRDAVSAFEQWQITHFGSNVPAEAQPQADPDGDRQDNQTEFAAGTLPKDGASGFRLTITRLPSGLMRLTWPGRSGKNYRIESSADLESGWMLQATLSADSDGPMHLDVTPGEEPTFFLVVLLE